MFNTTFSVSNIEISISKHVLTFFGFSHDYIVYVYPCACCQGRRVMWCRCVSR